MHPGSWDSDEDLQLLLDTAAITAEDLGVRREAYIKMAHFDADATLKMAILRLFKDKTNQQDEWLALALKTAAKNQDRPSRHAQSTSCPTPRSSW